MEITQGSKEDMAEQFLQKSPTLKDSESTAEKQSRAYEKATESFGTTNLA